MRGIHLTERRVATALGGRHGSNGRPWSALTPDEKLAQRGRPFHPGFPFAAPRPRRRIGPGGPSEAAILLEIPSTVCRSLLSPSSSRLSQWTDPVHVMHDYEKAGEPGTGAISTCSPIPFSACLCAIPGARTRYSTSRSCSGPVKALPTRGFQYDEREWMHADEYELLIADPRLHLHTYLPRSLRVWMGSPTMVSPPT